MRTASKGELTRQAVLDAAVECFGRDGFRATSVAHIARDAGVGGSVPYAYFASKEDLFLSALDRDASAVMSEGLSLVFDDPRDGWRQDLIVTLVRAVEAHPLARRVLAGLEPDVTERGVEVPALVALRRAVAERLAAEQLTGAVRPDIDPETVGAGLVSIILSLLMSVLQIGPEVTASHADGVMAVFEAALDPVQY
jgi:AcrR family transcriptional regulator